MSTANTEKIRVRFQTAYEKYRVSDAPFAVPLKLGRLGLSEVVNALLDLGEPQPFDFLIDGVLLRTSLNKFTRLHKISSENILLIEYLPAITLSDDSQSTDTPSWVGCIDSCARFTGDYNCLVAGCYDGQVQIVDKAGLSKEASFQAHNESIRGIVGFAYNGRNAIATCSKDHTVKLWEVSGSSSGANSVANLNAHIASVESLCVWSGRQVVLSGDWNGSIFGWSLSTAFSGTNSDGDDNGNNKKRSKVSKGGSSTGASLQPQELTKPLFSMRGHSQAISGMAVCGISSGDDNANGSTHSLLSCSWDHSLKKWDLDRQDCVATFTASKVMTSLDVSQKQPDVVLTSHPDGKVRLWDTRKQEDSLCSLVFSSSAKPEDTDGGSNSTMWVSQVRWHPVSEHVFASCDYSGHVRVWDTRSSLPLGSSEVHDGKVLCVDWAQAVSDGAEDEDNASYKVVSGGSDCSVRATRMI